MTPPLGLHSHQYLLEVCIITDYKQYIIYMCVCVCSFNITEQMVIYGIKDDVVTDKVLDVIMPMAKYYILRCICLKVVPNLFFKRSPAMRSDIQLCIFHYGAHTSC